jgi:hypothetical protein
MRLGLRGRGPGKTAFGPRGDRLYVEARVAPLGCMRLRRECLPQEAVGRLVAVTLVRHVALP